MSHELIIGGRYEIIEEIGKGGMAIVYKARCMVLNRYVALKVLRPEFRGDKEFVERFKIEAQSAGGLSHPNIVSIYDVGQTEDLNYIVMEYVEGITLKQYIAAKGLIGWKEAVDYAAQICAGLEHAHKKGIIHRDIKPQNIIITREGTAKITDFGIAKATNAATIEMGASNMGSVHYFSPEQARGGYVDCKSDIYSLGVILYEMVTGKVPFDGDNLVTIAMQHLETTPVAPTKLNSAVPASLEAIIGKAMAKDKAGRYEDVTKMLIDLKKVYIGTPVSFDNEKTSGDTVLIPPIMKNRGNDTLTEEVLERKPKAKTAEQEIILGKINGEEKKNKKGDRLSIILGIISGVILVALLSWAFYLVFLGGGVGDVTLPDLSGMTIEDAQKMLTESGLTELKVEKSGEEKSDDFSAGEIISQDPEKEKSVKENATIKVIISLGSDGVKMPQLGAMKEDEAKKYLNDLNINYTLAQEESEDIEEGYVIRQYPSAGTPMKKTDTATIYVSKGAPVKTVSVPNLIGMTESAAKSMLESLKLELGKTFHVISSKPEGTIAQQSLPAETEVKEGTAVDIRISVGKAEEDEPSNTDEPDTNNDGGNEDENKPSIRPVPNTLE